MPPHDERNEGDVTDNGGPDEDDLDDDGDDEDEEALDPVEKYFDAVDQKIETLYETSLKARIEALEANRLAVRGAIVRSLVVVGAPVALLFASDTVAGILGAIGGESAAVRWILDHLTLVLVGLLLLAVAYVAFAVVMPAVAAYQAYRRRFKEEVVAEAIRALMPSGSYKPDHHVTQAVFDSSGIWSGSYATFGGDDLVRGRVGTTDFEASEIRAIGRLTVQSKKRNQPTTHRPNVTLFHGLFFRLGLDRAPGGHTIVEPESAMGRLPGHRRGFQQVDFGNERFSRTFRVYTTDAAGAATVLGPVVRERLLELSEYLGKTPFVAFAGSHLFVAIHTGRPLLEPAIAKASSYGTISAVGDFFALPGLIVQELIAREPDAPAHVGHTFDAAASAIAVPAAARFGTGAGAGSFEDAESVAASDLANLGMKPADERDLSLRPPPESRVRVAPLTGEGLTVTYPLTASFFTRVVWTLVLTPFVAGGILHLAGESGRPALDALIAQVPPVATVVEWTARWPWAFVPIALLFYVLPSRALLVLPSGLHVNREGVRVSRRLWPLTKVYPLDRISDVRISDRQVILQRRDASLLRRYVFVAPPMQTAEHALWLAAHLRRGLTMFGGLR